MIRLYLPSKFNINSTSKFLDILHALKKLNNGILDSVDVESLFTSLPVKETIEYSPAELI